VILLLVGGAVVAPLTAVNLVLAVVVGIVWLVVDVIASSAIQLAAQWQRAVVFQLGKFRDIRGPGLFYISR
jgi:regulator of protease activity HflC (stomatin/prohibitin superfamily)